MISVTFVIGSFLAGVGSLLLLYQLYHRHSDLRRHAGPQKAIRRCSAVSAAYQGRGGAFIIGICENIIKGLDVILIKAGLSRCWGLTTFSDAFTFALLIVILIVKPTGLFGEKTTDKGVR